MIAILIHFYRNIFDNKHFSINLLLFKTDYYCCVMAIKVKGVWPDPKHHPHENWQFGIRRKLIIFWLPQWKLRAHVSFRCYEQKGVNFHKSVVTRPKVYTVLCETVIYIFALKIWNQTFWRWASIYNAYKYLNMHLWFVLYFFRDLAKMDENGYIRILGRSKVDIDYRYFFCKY